MWKRKSDIVCDKRYVKDSHFSCAVEGVVAIMFGIKFTRVVKTRFLIN